jgi:hypothetical protein
VEDKLGTVCQMNVPNTDDAIGFVDCQRILVVG